MPTRANTFISQRSYPQNPPAPDEPRRAPKRGDGRPFTLPSDNPRWLPADVIGVDSVGKGNVTCNNTDALSGVPYNVFSSSDTIVFGQFCSRVGPEKLEWTVDAHGFQKK